MLNTDFLHPQVRDIYMKFCEECNEKQISFELISTYNTKNEQNILYSKGRFGTGDICTNHKYPNSYHNWGLAFDIKPQNENELNTIVELLKSFGMSWGNDSNESCFNDKYHFYLPLVSIKDLKNKYGNYDGYRDIWNVKYKKPSMVTQQILDLAGRNNHYITRLQHACVVDNISTKNRQGITITSSLDAITIAAFDNVKIKFVNNKYYTILQVIQKLLINLGYKIKDDGTYTTELVSAITDFKSLYELNMDKLITSELILFLLAKIH